MQEITQSNARVETSEESEVERLGREVAELREENAANRAALAAVQAQMAGQPASPEPHAGPRGRDPSSRRRLGRLHNHSASEDEASGLVSRRRLFGLLGGAAAVGAGATLLAASPAEAAGNVVIDTINTGAATTTLTSTTNAGTYAMNVVSGNSSIPGGTAGHGFAGTGGNSTGSGGNGGVGLVGFGGSGAFGGDGLQAYGGGAGARGVFAHGDVGLLASSGLTPIRIVTNINPGAPTTGAHLAGDVYVDSNGVLWYCTADGTPGTWVNLSTGSKLVSIPPARIYDSRMGQLPVTGPKTPITNGTTVSLNVTNNSSGVPATAHAVLGNLTVTNTAGPGFLTVYANGASQPATSSINMSPGVTFANNFTSAVNSANSEISVTCGGVGPTDFIVDLVGYYP